MWYNASVMSATPVEETLERALAGEAAKLDGRRARGERTREAILAHLDELEDAYLAKERLHRGGERVSLEALEKEFEAEREA